LFDVEHGTMEDKRELLREPLHNIYIPIGLILFGTWIFGYEYLPYSIAFIIAVCTFQVYLVWHGGSSIHPGKWNDFELIDKTIISKNSAIYRFKLNRPDEVLDIPVGHHIACCFTINGKDEIRYYSPISNQFDTGFFDILVKSYEKGPVSSRFASLKEGQTVKFRGPVGRLQYIPNSSKHLALVAGGSGITPILQVITAIITNPEDLTKISLLYANETENDILLKLEIDEIASKYPGFLVHYTLTNPPSGWEGSKGYITQEMMEKYLPEPAEENNLFVCGPPLMKKLVNELAEKSGWDKDNQIFNF